MSQLHFPLWAMFIVSFVKSHGPPKEFTWATFLNCRTPVLHSR